jgi:hypothetical protein
MKKSKAIKHAKKCFQWWARNLGLGYQHTDLLFVDYIENDLETGGRYINPDQIGECHADWRYQNNVIYIAINRLKDMDKEEIERSILHELMHIFLNEMREDGIDHEERVATNLQKAFIWVRDSDD